MRSLARPAGGPLKIRRPLPAAPLRLVCLPYAGGAASIYRQWPQALSPDIEVVAVQPPGRENRLREAPHQRMGDLIDELMAALESSLDRPLGLFGHSLGALTAYELAHALVRRGHPPACLVVSGRRAPHLPALRPPMAHLDDAAFIERLRELGGTPEAVLLHDELMELLLPVLRADFALLESYQPTEYPPLPCPMLVCGGIDDDDVSLADLDAWRPHAAGAFRVARFPGGHFYLAGDAADDLRHQVADELRRGHRGRSAHG